VRQHDGVISQFSMSMMHQSASQIRNIATDSINKVIANGIIGKKLSTLNSPHNDTNLFIL
jgi:hypothetical protein